MTTRLPRTSTLTTRPASSARVSTAGLDEAIDLICNRLKRQHPQLRMGPTRVKALMKTNAFVRRKVVDVGTYLAKTYDPAKVKGGCKSKPDTQRAGGKLWRRRARRYAHKSRRNTSWLRSLVMVAVLAIVTAMAFLGNTGSREKEYDGVRTPTESIPRPPTVKTGPRVMLHKMLDIWKNKGTRTTIGDTEWKSICDAIPANIKREIIPDGQYGRMGFISKTLDWLFEFGYIRDSLQQRPQVIVANLSDTNASPDEIWCLHAPKEGYVLYATIYNTGAHYVAHLRNTTDLFPTPQVFEFNALRRKNPNRIQFNPDQSYHERIDISMQQTLFQKYIQGETPDIVNTDNGTNGCHINALWYVITGFPKLRNYIALQTGYPRTKRLKSAYPPAPPE